MKSRAEFGPSPSILSLTGRGEEKEPGFFAFGYARGFGWWKRGYPDALWGVQDALVPASYAAEFADLIPNARVEMIQAAGHVPQIEQRRLVSDHLTKFLTRG